MTEAANPKEFPALDDAGPGSPDRLRKRVTMTLELHLAPVAPFSLHRAIRPSPAGEGAAKGVPPETRRQNSPASSRLASTANRMAAVASRAFDRPRLRHSFGTRPLFSSHSSVPARKGMNRLPSTP